MVLLILDKHGNKALPYPQPLGVAVCRHDGVIICHGWEIGIKINLYLHTFRKIENFYLPIVPVEEPVENVRYNF